MQREGTLKHTKLRGISTNHERAQDHSECTRTGTATTRRVIGGGCRKSVGVLVVGGMTAPIRVVCHEYYLIRKVLQDFQAGKCHELVIAQSHKQKGSCIRAFELC